MGEGGGAGGQGYDTYGAEKQRADSNAASIDNLLGRKPSVIPSHLTRVLYVPRHGSSPSHLPLYDVSGEFSRAVGDTLIGSSLFTTKLAMMKTPSGEGRDAEVRYLVDIETRPAADGEELVARIQKRALGDVDGEVTMTFPLEMEYDTFKLRRPSADRQASIDVLASYPIPGTKVRGRGTVRHPYYSFLTPGDSTRMQWQTHPSAHGPLRRTLVRTSPVEAAGDLPRDEDTEAIFHHIWNGAAPVSRGQSEGFLLLPDGLDGELELLYIGSLMGLLCQERRLGGGDGKRSKKGVRDDGTGPGAKKLFTRMFRRR
ncbi:hypothetical protein ACRE_084890 [Hapsidospora chrysogenum ATCC 11550]|uniref:Uncharacterized protein n=1 Tax=Hapsidospora chrysogenum (strain ATCC 11550 / CBS 779.69 / DSM 880 / IAM 14645 / JCM 23072 / IMI 49137) TaxID=857340 RepID=A0A086SUN2_HAPC1|nr:hypothetical protein ACRE_084890 [Hapsidospora chrysogenum ATCC 11550]